jgi:tRNA 2-selenouridine synthase
MRQAQDITISEYLDAPDQFHTVIDVRAPSEFINDHIPGAVSHPVLSDEERAEIGTLHKQASGFVAKRRGAVLVARNIANTLEKAFAEKPPQWRPLVYCWRGGQRSNSMATIFSRIGWRASVLQGGYKTFRARVLSDLDLLPQTLNWQVLCGRTGTGKSEVLKSLSAAGAQVLDLEAIASHRGSVLGHLPGASQPAQKWFDSQVWEKLRSFDLTRPVFVESESKKIGALQVPQSLMSCMRDSKCIELTASLPERVALLKGQYQHFIGNSEGLVHLFRQLDCLSDLHGARKISDWKSLASAQKWDEFVTLILQEHYDPAYDKSIGRNFKRHPEAKRLEATNLQAIGIATITDELLTHRQT